jgi:hypothetical protein
MNFHPILVFLIIYQIQRIISDSTDNCNDPYAVSDSCIDLSLCRQDIMCTADYDPVCGKLETVLPVLHKICLLSYFNSLFFCYSDILSRRMWHRFESIYKLNIIAIERNCSQLYSWLCLWNNFFFFIFILCNMKANLFHFSFSKDVMNTHTLICVLQLLMLLRQYCIKASATLIWRSILKTAKIIW